MRFASALLSLFLLIICARGKVLKAINNAKVGDIDPITCIKCDAVVQLFHFLNDEVFGGEDEEQSRQKVLEYCAVQPVKTLLKKFCDEVKDGPLWDVVYRSFRDSLETFYQLIGGFLFQCPSLKVVQESCES